MWILVYTILAILIGLIVFALATEGFLAAYALTIILAVTMAATESILGLTP